MELEDGFDDLLAQISEPTSPKQLKLESETLQQVQPGERIFGISFKYQSVMLMYCIFQKSIS